MTFKPFADDSTALALGGLTLENGVDAISISGEITCDRQGLAHALKLKATVDDIVASLQARRDLPDVATPRGVEAPREVPNPFAPKS